MLCLRACCEWRAGVGWGGMVVHPERRFQNAPCSGTMHTLFEVTVEKYILGAGLGVCRSSREQVEFAA